MSTRNEYLSADDAALMPQIKWDFHKGSGNGGQKVNKTSSAVRITHTPTGITVTCRDSRSQSRNRQIAIDKLRKRMALEIRCPVEPVVIPTQIPSLTGAAYPLFLAQILDSVSVYGKVEGMTRSALERFLRRDEEVWRYISERREKEYAIYFNATRTQN